MCGTTYPAHIKQVVFFQSICGKKLHSYHYRFTRVHWCLDFIYSARDLKSKGNLTLSSTDLLSLPKGVTYILSLSRKSFHLIATLNVGAETLQFFTVLIHNSTDHITNRNHTLHFFVLHHWYVPDTVVCKICKDSTSIIVRI